MIVLRDAWYIVRVTGGPIGVLKGETRKKYSPEAGVGRSGGCLRERSPEESGIREKGKGKCGPCLHRGKAHEMCLVNKKKAGGEPVSRRKISLRVYTKCRSFILEMSEMNLDFY